MEVVTDFTITGTLARFGRGGMMQDIANRLLRDFAACLEQRLGSEQTPPAEASRSAATDAAPAAPVSPPPPAQAPPVKGLSLFFSVLWERIKRLFGGGK